MKITKALLIDAIVGAGLRDWVFADYLKKQGFARYTGDTWNESWAFDREALSALTEELLYSLYLDSSDPVLTPPPAFVQPKATT